MGLPQLIAATKTLSNPGPAPAFLGGAVGVAAILCVEDFLNVLAGTPVILATFKSLLQTLIIFIELLVKTLGLFVDTLIAQIDILTPLIQEYQAIKAQLASELNQLGIGRFTACPPVRALQDAITTQASGIPYLGAAFSGLRDMGAFILKIQYKVVKLEEQIARITAYIAQQNALVIFLQAIINAINAQYPGV